jgi:hypothetical protein
MKKHKKVLSLKQKESLVIATKSLLAIDWDGFCECADARGERSARGNILVRAGSAAVSARRYVI